MRSIEDCEAVPASCPSLDKIEKSKSTKKFKIDDLWFFTTESKNQGYCIYSVDLGVKLLCHHNKNFALGFLHKKLNELKELINGKTI